MALGLLDSLGEFRARYLPRLQVHPGESLCRVLGDDHSQAWAFVADLEDALAELGMAVPREISLCNPLSRDARHELSRARDMIGADEAIAKLKDEIGRMGAGC
jgi:hypothetical protein